MPTSGSRASLVLIFFSLAVYARFLRVEVQHNFGFTADLVVTLIAAVQLGPAPAAVIGVSVEAIAEIRRQVRIRLLRTRKRPADAKNTRDAQRIVNRETQPRARVQLYIDGSIPWHRSGARCWPV